MNILHRSAFVLFELDSKEELGVKKEEDCFSWRKVLQNKQPDRENFFLDAFENVRFDGLITGRPQLF